MLLKVFNFNSPKTISLTYFSCRLSLCLDAYCSVSSALHPQVLQFHSQCLCLCGDIQLMLAQNASNRAANLEEYSYQTKEDQEILHSLHRESSCQGQCLIIVGLRAVALGFYSKI